MEIFIKGKHCIITPLSPEMDKIASSRLKDEIKNHLLFDIGIDMSYVENCTLDFIKIFKNKKNLSLFNMSPDILALFNIMGLDKINNIYVFENDFLSSRHRLIKRDFKIVQA